MLLTRIAVTRPVFTVMIMIAMLVFGIVAYQRIAVDLYPKFNYPVVVVMTSYPGAAPETVETEVTRPVEEALNSIGGLDKVNSTSYEGRSVVTATFKLDVDSVTAAQEVRDRVSPLEGSFPKTVEKPSIQRFNPSDTPVISAAISSSSLGVADLTSLAERTIVKRLGTVQGVGQAYLIGGERRIVDIRIDALRLQALDVAIDDVVSALRAGNQNVPVGNIIGPVSDNTVQVNGRIDRPADLLDMIVARKGAAAIYLRDVASVSLGQADPSSRAIYNGEPALAVDVTKLQDANAVQVAKAVRKTIAELNEELASSGVSMTVILDTSVEIEESVHDVQKTLVEGALLAVVIVFLFLNSWRSTVITGLTLPIAMIGTIAVIHLLGFSLNMMSLLGLTLSIGILVDDAIVVRENITRHLHMGKSHFRAALDGTNEIGLAVIATTATIVAVFVPVAMMNGTIGEFLFQFGITVSVAVLISLFVSFTLDPMLSSVWYDPDSEPNARRGAVGRMVAAFEHQFERLSRGYETVVRLVLRRRLITLMAAAGVFVASLLMVPLVGTEFVTSADEGRMQVNITTPVGSSLNYSSSKLSQVEAALHEFPEIKSIYTTINGGAQEGRNKSGVDIQLVKASERSRNSRELAESIRDRLGRILGIKVSVAGGDLEGGDSPIQLSVLGENQKEIEAISANLVRRIRAVPGAVDVRSSLDEPATTLSIRLRRAAASDLGIDVQRLGSTLNTLVGGEKVTKWTDDSGETFDVVARLPKSQRLDLDMLMDLKIQSERTEKGATPAMISLHQVAEVVETSTPAEIRRFDRRREVLISADVQGRPLGDVTQAIDQVIADAHLPSSISIKSGGTADDMDKTMTQMGSALVLAIVLIYLVLASQFGSFLQPLAIMVTLPMSLAGVVLGLLVAGSTLNMFSMIGFIMLMGLVTKNGILLVDFANQERKRGLSLQDALISAGLVRFRPIVMTTLAMIFGMIPLAIATTGGGAQRAPMAHAVIGGLISSTVLTLVIVPVLVSYIDSLSRLVTPWLPHAPQEHPPEEFAGP